MFDKKFFESLPSDDVLAAAKIVRDTYYKQKHHYTNDHEFHLDGYGIVTSLVTRTSLEIPRPAIGTDRTENIKAIRDYLEQVFRGFDELRANSAIDQWESRAVGKFGAAFAYEFSEGDLDRVQTLINELREEISNHPRLEDGYRARLLKRLEKLQSELHKKMSDLDRVWGFLSEAGVFLGKFGEDAKPIVDRLRELAGIVWRTQARTEELPSAAQNPLKLTSGTEEKD